MTNIRDAFNVMDSYDVIRYRRFIQFVLGVGYIGPPLVEKIDLVEGIALVYSLKHCRLGRTVGPIAATTLDPKLLDIKYVK